MRCRAVAISITAFGVQSSAQACLLVDRNEFGNALADLALSWAQAGAVGAGYELLSSDHGIASFSTPLATAHKFNGWADAFLNNGGADGLQDLYAYVAPVLPWKLKGQVVFHQFYSHARRRNYGRELEAVLTPPAYPRHRPPVQTAPSDRARGR